MAGCGSSSGSDGDQAGSGGEDAAPARRTRSRQPQAPESHLSPAALPLLRRRSVSSSHGRVRTPVQLQRDSAFAPAASSAAAHGDPHTVPPADAATAAAAAARRRSVRSAILWTVVKLSIILCFLADHLLWMASLDTHQALRRLAVYAAVVGLLVCISRAIAPRFYLHWHHYLAGLMLIPFGHNACPDWSLVLQGVCISQFIDGASRWSCAPLWHWRNNYKRLILTPPTSPTQSTGTDKRRAH